LGERHEKGGSKRCQVISLLHVQADSDLALGGEIRSRIAAVACAAKALGGHLAQEFCTFIYRWLALESIESTMSNHLE